ncbi:MAG: peptidase M20 [Flammeovirgaceae bacterium]|nr:peptidase M20 [Flammeovirgaceae bacterium]MBE62796.1 peptidase M20 [Flammeovirgaceae bacterium]HCX22197.1 amidohydrolase [Cytophagales bacterium]|tara:strand:- start:3523 stop:4818 length:1296 start_codon:yes stop_codon:yes gene_type:complete
MRLSSLLLVLFFSTGSILLSPKVNKGEIAKDKDYLVNLYKSLHQSPELSLEEKETSKKLANELRKVGFDVTENIGGYGIVGILKNGEGPTILYRTDMDALPMYEKTGLPYVSKVEVPYNGGTVGTMHSCGHDIHMTNWVGTARYMSRIKDQWKGTLMFIGQPAEEIGAGARAMLNDGLYEKFGVPDYGIGLHSSPSLPAGTVGLSSGFTMANSEFADIKVYGIGAHGATPHMSIDPVVTASMIVMELQTIASRSVKPIDDVVVTVGAIKGGTKHNIIPDEVTLQLTVRTFSEEVRLLVHQRIAEISRGVAIAAGLPEDKLPEVVFREQFTPANFNNPELIKSLRESAAKVIDSNNILEAEPQMVAEDFSLYGKTDDKVPTALFWLGTVPDQRIQSGDLPGLHSPFYYPEPGKSLETGVAVVSQAMLDLLNQ